MPATTLRDSAHHDVYWTYCLAPVPRTYHLDEAIWVAMVLIAEHCDETQLQGPATTQFGSSFETRFRDVRETLANTAGVER